jgi:hypothetical protein
MRKILAQELGDSHPQGPNLAQASYYFRFYLARALEHANLGRLYLKLLKPWRDLLPVGFTTWPEQPEPTRSDSHVWSAHPNYDLLTIAAGIKPIAPGFTRVEVTPNMASLEYVRAVMPHPMGSICVDYKRKVKSIEASITLPDRLQGFLVWRGKRYNLRGGEQKFSLSLSAGSRDRIDTYEPKSSHSGSLHR